MTALEGPLRAAVIRIAWPAALGYLLIFANNFVDYFWVKLLGTEASAGQTAGWMLFWMVGSFGQIFSVGVTAVVARRVGRDGSMRPPAPPRRGCARPCWDRCSSGLPVGCSFPCS